VQLREGGSEDGLVGGCFEEQETAAVVGASLEAI